MVWLVELAYCGALIDVDLDYGYPVASHRRNLKNKEQKESKIRTQRPLHQNSQTIAQTASFSVAQPGKIVPMP